jgi:hypothetical protein
MPVFARCLLLLPIAASALACATAGDDPEAKITGDSGHHDSTFGDGTAGDGQGDGREAGPIFDAGPVCGDLGAPNTCETVTDLGTIALGDKKSVTGNVSLTASPAEVWYKVAFAALDDLKAHPHVVITGGSASWGFHFEIINGCTRVDLACGAGEDASSADITDFEDKWATDPASDGGVPDGDAIIPLTVGAGGTIYIRVFRVGGDPTGCDGFDLEISN